MTTCNMYRKFGETRTCHFCDMLADIESDKQTCRHADQSISHSYAWDEVIKSINFSEGKKFLSIKSVIDYSIT